MKRAIVFPTFWSRPSDEGIHPDDFYYDHPLPLDRDGWLPCCFEELKSLDDQDFVVLVVAGGNTPDIRADVQRRIRDVIDDHADGLETHVISYEEHETITRKMTEAGHGDFCDTLSMVGYSDLRNLCLLGANLLDADLAVSIDDDVTFHETDWLGSVTRGIGREVNGQPVHALAGGYLHDLQLKLDVPEEGYVVPWNTTPLMNDTFEEFFTRGSRYKESHFAIMGNIAVTRDFYKEVPLDPAMRRGEDSDWVFNAKLLDRRFVLDRELRVHHQPPERPHPVWRSMREDIARFLYQRKKYHAARDHRGGDFPTLDFFKPFPGRFWEEDLEQKISDACNLLATKYLAEDRPNDAQETLKNLYLAEHQFGTIDRDPVESYLDFQETWANMMDWVESNASELRRDVFD